LEDGEQPPRVTNPRTKETFVLLPAKIDEKARRAMDVEEIDPSLYEFEEAEDSPS
jgi:hypothetical protein